MDREDGEFLYHTHCDACGSSDGKAIYSNDTSYCFVCTDVTSVGNNVKHIKRNKNVDLVEYEYKALNKRKIPKDICSKYRYGVGEDKDGKRVQVENYFNNDKEIIAQKLRYANKDFKAVGNIKESMLFGQQLFSNKGMKITITEGAIDCLSVSTAFDGKYPIISIKNGATAAKKEIAANLEYLDGYDEIYLWFDNDDAGRKATEECIAVLPAHKVRVIRDPDCKDANEVLIKKGKAGVIQAYYNATKYMPDDIKSPMDLLEVVGVKAEMGFPYCYEGLTKHLYGRRFGEVVTLGAAVAAGKTSFVMSMAAMDVKAGYKVGTFMLEQSTKETLQRVAGQMNGKHYHIPDTDFDIEELKDVVRDLDGKLYLFDNFGANEWEVIIDKVRYMKHNYDVNIFYVDNLTSLNAASDDERRQLDKMMAAFAGLAQELNVWIMLVSHLNPTKTGPTHESGGRVELGQLTGSKSIGRWSHAVLGLERNTLHEDPIQRNRGLIRILKNRFSGEGTGEVVGFQYDKDTGLCHEVSDLKSIVTEETTGDNNDF